LCHGFHDGPIQNCLQPFFITAIAAEQSLGINDFHFDSNGSNEGAVMSEN
jgi:hypothetical protein